MLFTLFGIDISTTTASPSSSSSLHGIRLHYTEYSSAGILIIQDDHNTIIMRKIIITTASWPNIILDILASAYNNKKTNNNNDAWPKPFCLILGTTHHSRHLGLCVSCHQHGGNIGTHVRGRAHTHTPFSQLETILVHTHHDVVGIFASTHRSTPVPQSSTRLFLVCWDEPLHISVVIPAPDNIFTGARSQQRHQDA
jgi:hypothetical protein